MITKKFWKPMNALPWHAEKRGTVDYDWFVIFDRLGNQVCATPGCNPGTDEHNESARAVAMLLTSVNKSNVFKMNDDVVRVQWNGEHGPDISAEGEVFHEA